MGNDWGGLGRGGGEMIREEQNTNGTRKKRKENPEMMNFDRRVGGVNKRVGAVGAEPESAGIGPSGGRGGARCWNDWPGGSGCQGNQG